MRHPPTRSATQPSYISPVYIQGGGLTDPTYRFDGQDGKDQAVRGPTACERIPAEIWDDILQNLDRDYNGYERYCSSVDSLSTMDPPLADLGWMRLTSPGRPLYRLRLVSKIWNQVALRITSVWLVFNGRKGMELCKALRSRYPRLATATKRIDLPMVSWPLFIYSWDIDALEEVCAGSPNLQTISFCDTDNFQDIRFYDKFCKILCSLPFKASLHVRLSPGSWTKTVPAIDCHLTRIRF